MQLSFKTTTRRNQSGWALTVVLAFLLATLIVFASIMYWVISSARVTARNNLFNISEAAAQGAAETAISELDRDFTSQSLASTNVYMMAWTNINQTGWPVQFTFSDTNGNANQIYVSWSPQNWGTNLVYLNSQFQGLYAYAASVDVIAVATATNAGYNMSAKVEETAQLAAIPVFQFGVFYNVDLDFSPGVALIMNGKVHCNGTIWMYPQATATFNDIVEATVIVTNKDNPNDQQNLTSYTTPIKYNGGNPVSGVDTLNMPIAGGNSNVESILNLPPAAVAAPNSSAYAITNQIYLYNACNLIISNAASGVKNAAAGIIGTNFTLFYQDQYDQIDSGGPLFRLTNNEICTFSNTKSPNNLYTTNSPYGITTNYVCIGSGFPFLTNASFFDFREQDTVQVVQVDIAKFNSWLTNINWEGYHWNQVAGGSDGVHGYFGHPIDSIYVYSSVARTTSQFPAVRVINGQQLFSSKGLTVATPFPLYTLGNYNIQTNASGPWSYLTTNTAWCWPAALMGDAITVLSANWQDSYASSSAYTSRSATNTTVNAAMLEGIVISTNISGGSASGKRYSGGLENFLRLIETWGNGTTTLCYNGSIIVMFPSMYATNYWQIPGVYYDKPLRNWGFDSNFKDSTKIPPCAPAAKAIVRGNWNATGK